jgi:vacuolar-type H+-ATPase subunit H
MATAAAPEAPAGTSIDALKRVRQTEIEWDERLRSAKKSSEELLGRTRDESQAAVEAARAEADAEHTKRVTAARADADRDASVILLAGEAAATVAASGAGKRPADHSAEILAAVLGGFRTD